MDITETIRTIKKTALITTIFDIIKTVIFFIGCVVSILFVAALCFLSRDFSILLVINSAVLILICITCIPPFILNALLISYSVKTLKLYKISVGRFIRRIRNDSIFKIVLSASYEIGIVIFCTNLNTIEKNLLSNGIVWIYGMGVIFFIYLILCVTTLVKSHCILRSRQHLS